MDRFEDEAKSKANDRWNAVHQSYEREKIKYDDWLELFDTVYSTLQYPNY